ncbi:MAG: o-succinylbenzoate synthase [Candidatus Nanopelagicaceae bacterium]|nr:o-succinylbenzoate synthase [Candidatus Nanopelagicaceae bacterium]
MIDQLLASMQVVALPLKRKFRGITTREVALIQGPAGLGEFSPFLEYDDAESSRWLLSAIDAATNPAPMAYRGFIKVNATLPALNDSKEIEELLNSYSGCDTIKIKVGENLSEDIVRVARVRALRPKAKLRLDVNGGWSVDQALINLYEIYEEVGPLEYVEQPCATLAELRELKSKLKIDLKIAGDEVIRKASDPFAIDLQGAVDILMLKVAPLGGITRSREIGAHHKLPLVVSSALESAIGISYGLQLASSLPTLNYASGLATGQLISANIATIPVIDGQMQVNATSPDPELLAKYAVPVERLDWWKERAKRAFYAGAESEIKARGWVW